MPSGNEKQSPGLCLSLVHVPVPITSTNNHLLAGGRHSILSLGFLVLCYCLVSSVTSDA